MARSPLPPERPGHRRRRHVLEVAFDATPSTIRLGLGRQRFLAASSAASANHLVAWTSLDLGQNALSSMLEAPCPSSLPRRPIG